MTCPTSLRQIGWYFLLPIPNIHQPCSPSPFSLELFFFFFLKILNCYYYIYFYFLLFTSHPFYYLLGFSLTLTPFSTTVSKKFQPYINVVRIIELNFVLCSEIFVHYDGQLRASHLILGCVPFYTSYQNSSNALMIDNPLLSYLDI